ncbi:MAG: potassium channel family protein [Candidatus Thorarchaeota archaeon]
MSLKRLLKTPTGEESPEERILVMLIQMKDTSELLINLAYTALLTNNKDIAEDIFELEEKFDNFHTEFELEVLRLELEEGEEKRRLGLIRLGVAAENLSDAAAQMAEIVLRGVDVHPIMQLALKDADERVSRQIVNPNSILANKTLRQLRLEDHGTRIFAVKRKDQWTYDPRGRFKLKPGDIIYAGGYKEAVEKLEGIAQGTIQEL